MTEINDALANRQSISQEKPEPKTGPRVKQYSTYKSTVYEKTEDEAEHYGRIRQQPTNNRRNEAYGIIGPKVRISGVESISMNSS